MEPKSPVTWTSSTETFHGGLEDVCLDENARTCPKSPTPSARAEVLGSIVHECFFVGATAFAAASSVFFQRSIVIISSDVVRGLNLSPAEAAWLNGASGYISRRIFLSAITANMSTRLTTGAFLIPFGHLADVCPILSRKYLLILSLTAFSLVVAFTSFSRSGVVIDIMCGLAGLACAAIIPIAVGILSLVYPVPSRRKNIVFSSFLVGNPAATIIGGLGTGALSTSFNWKAAFIFLGIMYALITILCWIVVPNVSESRPDLDVQEEQQLDIADPMAHIPHETPNFGAALHRFDWIGLFVLVAGVLMLTIALTIGPEGSKPWKTPAVILLLTLGLLFVGCFIMWESSTSTPMIPPAVWRSNSVCLVSWSVLSPLYY